MSVTSFLFTSLTNGSRATNRSNEIRCIEFCNHAEVSFSTSAHEIVFVSGMSIAPEAGTDLTICCGSAQLRSFFLAISFGSALKNSKIPVSAQWCSPNVSMSIASSMRSPAVEESQFTYLSAMRGYSDQDFCENLNPMSSVNL